MIEITRKFWYVIFLIVIFNLISLIGWIWPIVNTATFWFLVIAILLVAWKRLDLALWVVLAELIIGSKGYLFSANIFGLTVSIRLALFLAVISVWFLKHGLKRRINYKKSNTFGFYILFILILIWGVAGGYLNNNSLGNIFFDANGFLYFGLIFIFYEVIKNRQRITSALEVLFASIIGIGINTMVLLYLFAGQYSFLPEIYRWARDTRMNEITLIAQNFYRVFSQSHIYSLFGLIISLTIITLIGKKRINKNYRIIVFIFLLASLSTLISYSRSFWLSLAIVFCLMLFVFVKYYNFGVSRIFKYAGMIFSIAILELGFIYVYINIPNWIKPGRETTALSSIVEERLTNTSEASMQSRWNLLDPLGRKIIHSPVLGTGFGSEITYLSEDPRNLENKYYTTYMTEWGYLDLMMKVGLVGLIIFILFLWKIAQNGLRAFRNNIYDDKVIILAFLLCFSALLVTHITTPYLNHPLGIGFIMLTSVIFERLKNNANLE